MLGETVGVFDIVTAAIAGIFLLFLFIPIFPYEFITDRNTNTDQKHNCQNCEIHTITSHFLILQLILKVLGETVGVFDIVTAAIAGVFLFALYTVFQIPGYYKYGSIKGRVFMYIPVAGFLVTLLLLSKIPAIGNSIISVVESFPILLVFLAVFAIVVMYAVSIICPIAKTKTYRPITSSLLRTGKIPNRRSMLFFSVMEKVYPVVMAIKHIANDTPVSKERLIAANTIGRSRVKQIVSMGLLSLIISLIAQPLILKVLGETVGVFDIVTAAIAARFCEQVKYQTDDPYCFFL